jgi:hypothetical protein
MNKLKVDHCYEIIFLGKVKAGVDSRLALQLLMEKSGVSSVCLKSLIGHSPCRIKTFHTLDKAKLYVKSLWRLGWHTSLHFQNKLIFSTLSKDKPSLPSFKPDEIVEPAELEVESLLFPNDWKSVSGLNPNASLQAGSVESNCYCISIAQKKRDFQDIPKHYQYAKSIVNNACHKIADVYIEEFCRLIKIDKTKAEAYLSELYVFPKKSLNSSHSSADDLVYLIAVFEGEQAFYSLYFWCPRLNYQRLKSTFLRIIESFRLENRQYTKVA